MPEILLPRDGEWRVLTPEARDAAERHELGQPVDVYALTSGLSRRKINRVYEFARGVVRQDHGGPAEVFRLADMTEVTARVADRTYNGRYDATYFTFTIACAHGGPLRISAYYKSRSDHGYRYFGLGEAIREHVATRRLPAARERLRQGHEVSFGDFGLSRDGLIWKGKRPVPWEYVGPARTKEGWLTVELSDGRPKKCERELAVIPDYGLFLTLLAELRESPPRVG
ncbi:DUF6585 family protein [Streptomyces mobaraensis]|uniref:DUF6585 family protein n=1 Tax=Streptomyces mobaraensis TaxID=35621 RepID=UPI0033DF4D22